MKKAQAKQGKIYVGKIPQELSDEEIKSFFEQYGAIVTVEQPFDKMKNERKNFCFVTFEKEEPAKKLLKEETVKVSGNELVIKEVTPKRGRKSAEELDKDLDAYLMARVIVHKQKMVTHSLDM